MRGSVVRAVNGVTYDLEFGESLGIVGESGCGKSVSVLSLLKLLPEPPAVIEADSIAFNGKDLLDASVSKLEKIRGKEIGMIFQDPMTSLNPVLTVGRQIEETLIEHLDYDKKRASNKAVELLELVGIPEAAQRVREYPHQFSGGMRQRAMIAMALSCNPKLLIADEPTTALDVTIQAQILKIIKNLTAQFGMSLIIITHSLGVVADICDRVIVMYAGFIVEEAPTVELFGNPIHPYTQALLKSIPQIDHDEEGDLPSIEGIPPDLAYLSDECPFKERCKEECDDEHDANPPIVEVDTGHFVRCWKHAS
jgi:oligopeptide transport system ATP-binding protein